MKRYTIIIALAATALLAGTAAWAQAPAPGGTAPQGFTVETLLSQLSLYLPEDALPTGGLGGFGRGGTGTGTAQGAAAGSGTTAQGGATARSGTTAQGGQNFGQLFQYKRDTKLFLTKDQITKLLPVLQGLRDNPVPTPSKAKAVQASVDGILTVAQKAEYADYQKQMAKAFEEIRKQFAAAQSGSGPGAGTGAGPAGGFGGGQDPNGAQAGQQRQGSTGGTQLSLTERRQRELDAFIKALQDRQKQL